MRKPGKPGKPGKSYRRGWPERPKEGVIMAIIRSTAKAGRKIPKEVIQEVRRAAKEARKHPEAYDPECPPGSPQALAEFAARARELRKRKAAPVVSIRVKTETLEKYRALGRGYSGVMADVLNYVADNPDILSKIQG
jgi:uncharacterized protein (DUF4415 family)